MENRTQIFKFSIKGIKGLKTRNIEPWGNDRGSRGSGRRDPQQRLCDGV